MKLFQIKIDIEESIEAENEQEAKVKFFEMIESEPQQTIPSFVDDNIKVLEMCPHCEIPLEMKMIDTDGTNLEEHAICPTCGYGTPALR